jgi:hypothetical protein
MPSSSKVPGEERRRSHGSTGGVGGASISRPGLAPLGGFSASRSLEVAGPGRIERCVARGIAVEPVADLQQERDGLCVAPGDALAGEAQRRRQPGDLHPLVVRRLVLPAAARRSEDDLPQPLSREALLGRDFGVTGAVLHPGKDALDAQRARRGRKSGTGQAGRRGEDGHARLSGTGPITLAQIPIFANKNHDEKRPNTALDAHATLLASAPPQHPRLFST